MLITMQYIFSSSTSFTSYHKDALDGNGYFTQIEIEYDEKENIGTIFHFLFLFDDMGETLLKFDMHYHRVINEKLVPFKIRFKLHNR